MKKVLFLFALVAFLGTSFSISAQTNAISETSTLTVVNTDNDKDQHCCKHATKAECQKDSENCCKDKNCECHHANCDKKTEKSCCDKKAAKSCCDKKSAKKGSSCQGHPGESCNHHGKSPKK